MQERKGSQVQRFKPHQKQQSMLHNHKVIMLRKLSKLRNNHDQFFLNRRKGSTADEEAFLFLKFNFQLTFKTFCHFKK